MLKVGAGLLALGAAWVVHAAPAVPACPNAAPDVSWADCAGVLLVDGESTWASSIDFATLSLDADRAPPMPVDVAQAVAAIPEPHTNLLMLAGLAAIGFMTMRRRRP